ncbi:GreA/GreB family elongation factor [Saccharopolyspora taberi]|uniref:GreA/GreB family elongation factor n=1 Tax=Saccharopolyspora taberi TaxID=60895 RepID=A0ABN3V9E0_9PSEU
MSESSGSHRPRLSAEARGRLEDELRSLREQRRQLAEDLSQRDATTGDRGDESQALEGADTLAWFDDRIAALERRLSGAGPVPEGLPSGTAVTLRFRDGTVQELHVVSIPEEIPEGAEDVTLTSDSPLGLALVDSRPGTTVTYPTPNGREEAEVVDIRPPS